MGRLWAVDADGRPTTDPEAALTGALLPFGGYKGANIALLVELLSSIAGGRWAVDAPPWDSGSRSSSIGMFVLAVGHSALGPGFPARVDERLERLAGSGVRLPGSPSRRATRCFDRAPDAGLRRGRAGTPARRDRRRLPLRPTDSGSPGR